MPHLGRGSWQIYKLKILKRGDPPELFKWALNPMSSVLVTMRWKERDTYREEGHVEIGPMLSRAKDAGSPHKRQKRIPLRAPGGSAALPHPRDFGLLASNTEREYISVVLSHSVCYSCHRKGIQAPHPGPVLLPWEAFLEIPGGPWGHALCWPGVGSEERGRLFRGGLLYFGF